MSRRNKKQRQTTRTHPSPAKPPTSLPPSPTPTTESAAETLEKVENAALQHASEDDLQAMRSVPPPPTGTSTDDLLKRAADTVALLEVQRKRLDEVEADLGRRVASVHEREETLVKQEGQFTERETKLKADELDLNRRHEEVAQRELDADAGFIRRNREALARLDAEGEAAREEAARQREVIAESWADHERKLQEQRDRTTAELDAQRTKDAEAAAARRSADESALSSQREELETAREALTAEGARLRKLSRDIDLDRELLDEDREAFDDKVAQRAAREVELKDGELRSLAERLEAARAERDRFAQLLSERAEADRRFGGETPDEVLKRLRARERECEQLRKSLGERPSAEASQRLEELVRKKELWESDRLRLLAEIGEARDEAARRRIAVTELASLRDEKRSLESANAILHEANRQLRAEVDALIKGVEGKSPFPSCCEMDADGEFQSSLQTREVRSLRDFAEYVRHAMAWDPRTKKELYYSAEDVRSFIGGLAMSRLHLLQGISGTGKTSLPLAFARAIGSKHEHQDKEDWAVIEVQAGWRDRQDLVGHFNTFERRFYESEFLKALYRASTPRHRDRPFIVVLDEMNLSHPEQYFADLISALEHDQHRQRLVLMTAAVDPAPRLLADGGTKLPIPPNVWFIGTANHDETTKDFADKTYDRAHVMELPRNRETFKREDLKPQDPISLEALQIAFTKAKQTHGADAARAYGFLQDELGETLGRRFRVGWGHRLERQLGFYLPVVVAAGGTVAEATDHILATKLLRKIRDRHDNRPEDIIALRERIQTGWSVLDKKHEPRRSLALLQQELHRLGHDDD